MQQDNFLQRSPDLYREIFELTRVPRLNALRNDEERQRGRLVVGKSRDAIFGTMFLDRLIMHPKKRKMEETLSNDQAKERGSDDAVTKERVPIQPAEKQEHEKHDSRNDQTREPITGSVRANNKWHQGYDKTEPCCCDKECSDPQKVIL